MIFSVISDRRMTDQELALTEIAGRLQALRVPYAVIGGMANAVWGSPRSTLDIDVTLWVDEAGIDRVIQDLATEFRILPDSPREFVRETRVLPLESREAVRIDTIFGMLPFEQAVVERAVSKPVAGGEVRFCTAEDLVLLKIISDREQDLQDARGILQRRGPELDRTYLDARIKEMAEALERADILDRYKEWLPGP